MSHTFLFSDLVGWTALAAERGDEQAAEVALAYRHRVTTLLHRHGAEEVKALGDGVMLRADDPAAAVRLALGIVREIEREGLPPVRVGVHTGPAVEREGDWYGTTVNVASRLCGAAGGGQVLISVSTLQAAGPLDGVEVSEPRLHWLKNLREPVAAHLATELEPDAQALRRFARTRGALAKLAAGCPSKAHKTNPREAIIT